MFRNKGLYLMAVGVLASVAFVSQAVSQDSRPAGGGPGSGRGNGRGFGFRGGDPAQMRAEMDKAMKEMLGASDDEWKVLQPKIEKVQTAQREARGGMNFGRLFAAMRGDRGADRGGDRGNQPDPNRTQTEVEKASSALSKVLDNKDSKTDDIKSAMQTLRDARAKAKANVEAAQKDLKEVLTLKQEAELVDLGLLE